MKKFTLVGPFAGSHINFPDVMNFPMKEFSEPMLRAPVAVLP